MGLIDFIVLLVVAGICGALGRAVSGARTPGGCMVSIAIGFIGALIGVWLARTLALPDFFTFDVGGRSFPIIWSIVGSALFVAVLSLFTRRR